MTTLPLFRCSLPLILAGSIMLATTAPVLASEGLGDYYRRAMSHDAEFAAAQAASAAETQQRAIGRAGLLPNIGMSYSSTRTHLRRDETAPVGLTRDVRYDPSAIELRLTQPLFDLTRWANYREGDLRAERADIILAEARQDLALRVAQAYFNYLLAADNLELAQAQTTALAARQVEVEGLMRAGSATRTDVEETRARHQLSAAQQFAARSTYELRRKELGKISGKLPPPFAPAVIVAPQLVAPEPAEIDTWIEAARTRNLKVLAQQATVSIADQQVERARAAFAPVVNLVASRQKGQESSYFINREDTGQIGVQISMNLFEGGGTTARFEQAGALRQQSRHELDGTLREAEVKASQSYLEIHNGIAQVRALEQAVKSAQVALEGMESGQKVGLRTNSDVLNAQQQLFSARRDLQKERYAYILNRLNLQAAVGALRDAEIEGADRLAGIPPR